MSGTRSVPPTPVPLTDASAGTLTLGGDLRVRRLGFGALQLCGPHAWGPPQDRAEAHSLLRRAIELGVQLIDTADSYGPSVNEELVAEALAPYPDGVVIATKGGWLRGGPGSWTPDGRPEHLRAACEGSLRRLRLECIDLYQLHVPDPRVPFEESVGVLAELRSEGKIRHVGLSRVSVTQLETACRIVEVVTVQNRFSLLDTTSVEVLEACERRGLGFMPWRPLAGGELAKGSHGGVEEVTRDHGATPAQVAIAWLLARSPMMLPIPGSASRRHLEENIGAAMLRLRDGDMRKLGSA